MSDASYSRKTLLDFTERLEKQGLAKPNTARGLKVAATSILEGLSDQEENDVRKVDVDMAVRRYNNKNPGKLSPRSLAEYRRRVETLIREFVKYHDDPTRYSGIGRGTPAANDGATKRKTPAKARRDSPERMVEEPSPREEHRSPRAGLSLEFPLREDFLAQVVVPRDLKEGEARRLCAFVMTLAADYSPKDL